MHICIQALCIIAPEGTLMEASARVSLFFMSYFVIMDEVYVYMCVIQTVDSSLAASRQACLGQKTPSIRKCV